MPAINFTSFGTPSLFYPSNCIASPEIFNHDIRTNKTLPTAGGCTLALRPVSFIDSALSPETANLPGDVYYKIDLPNSFNPPVAPGYVTYTAGFYCLQPHFANLKHYFIQVNFYKYGGNRLGFNVIVKWINLHDFTQYLGTGTTDNKFKLIKDSAISNAILDNNSNPNDVYNYTKQFRVALWFKDTDGYVSSYVSKHAGSPLRFYNRDLNNTVLSNFTNPVFSLYRCSDSEVTTLSNTQSTNLRFDIDYSGLTIDESLVMAIRTDTTNNVTDFITNYAMNYKETSFLADVLTDPTWLFVPNIANVLPTDVIIATAGNNDTGSHYDYGVTIDMLPLNSKWRFITVLNCTITAVSGHKFSFISDEYVVQDCGCWLSPNLLKNGIYDLNSFLGDYAGVAPQERLKSRVEFDIAQYDIDNAIPFASALKNVRIKVYSEQSNVKHVYYDKVVTRDIYGSFILPSDISLTFGTECVLIFSYRARYENDVPNLYSEVGGISQAPLSVMSWIGKTIHLFFTFEAVQADGTKEIYKYRHKLEVYDYDNLTLPLTINAVLPICDTNIEVCATNNDCIVGDNVAFIDNELFGINNLCEDDNVATVPNFTATNCDIFVVKGVNFGIGGTQCWELDINELELDQKYRFSNLKKDDLLWGRKLFLGINTGTLSIDNANIATNITNEFSGLGCDPFSFELWIRPITSMNAWHLFSWDAASVTSQSIGMTVSPAGFIAFNLRSSVGNSVSKQFVAMPIDSLWHHLVFVRRNATSAGLELWLDGVLQAGVVTAVGTYTWCVPAAAITSNACIAGLTTNNTRSANYRQIRGYERALSADEIVRNFNLGKDSSAPHNDNGMFFQLFFDELPKVNGTTRFPSSYGTIQEYRLDLWGANPANLFDCGVLNGFWTYN